MYLNLRLPLYEFARTAIIGSYKYIRVMSDSSIAITYINNKGSIKSKTCNEIAKEIWSWCFKNNSFISVACIPGKHNIEADKFPENLTMLQNGNVILRYLLKLLISLAI